MKVAIVGTNGLPAKYGGFETLVEYLAEYLQDEFELTIYCSGRKPVDAHLSNFPQVRLIYINIKANGWQSIFYDFLSLMLSIFSHDKVIVLGCSGSIFQPIFYPWRSKIIMNLGGLDWQRSKWSFLTRKYLLISENFGIKFSGTIVSDNVGISKYILQKYKRSSVVIAYGGDHAVFVDNNKNELGRYGLVPRQYACVVARIQDDNNIGHMCEAFLEANLPLVVIGNWQNSEYGNRLKKKYDNVSNLILLEAIYDKVELNRIRSNCMLYVHGHSAGGTNPALVEAMNLGLPILAYSNEFNEYTTGGLARYWKNVEELTELLKNLDIDWLNECGQKMLEYAALNYTWETVASKYSRLLKN